MTNIKWVWVAGLVGLTVNMTAEARRFRGIEDPDSMGANYTSNFNSLPLSASLPADKTPWSDSYWPNADGGIANRWQTDQKPWYYTSPNLAQLRSMSSDEIKVLSPAEKYDIYMGRYDYPTVNAERSRTSPRDKGWFGLCHGWSVASARHKEPMAVNARNPDGILIPFGSSDIKALLTYYYGVVEYEGAPQVGRICNAGRLTNVGCRGMNPGSFHIVLANQIGLLKEGFQAELDVGREIWNHPVFGYESRVLRDGRLRTRVVTTMHFATDSPSAASFVPTLGTSRHATDFRQYEYILQTDRRGNIVGGRWAAGSDRPDAFWFRGVEDFDDPYYRSIMNLYKSR